MRGELIGVWSATWREIWAKLAKHPEFGDNLFPDLYRELVPAPSPPHEPPQPPPEAYSEEGELIRQEDIEARDAYDNAREAFDKERSRYEEAVSGGHMSRQAFRNALKEHVVCEGDAVATLGRAYSVVSSYGEGAFSDRYFQLVEQFLTKFSLRYDLRRPFSLNPTLTGLFTGLIRELKNVTEQDHGLHLLMVDFEEAVRDLGLGATPGRMKTCFFKQFNLLEALASRYPGVRGNVLGQMVRNIHTWPHNTVRQAAEKIYAFRGAYPGMGHGNGGGARREIEMRDLVAVSVMLAGFTSYLTDRIDSDSIYHGA